MGVMAVIMASIRWNREKVIDHFFTLQELSNSTSLGSAVLKESFHFQPGPYTWWVFFGVFCLLVLASALAFISLPFGKLRDEVIARIKTWWIIVVLFWISMQLKRLGLLTLLCVISYLGFKEYISVIPTRRADRRVLLWAYVSIPVQVVTFLQSPIVTLYSITLYQSDGMERSQFSYQFICSYLFLPGWLLPA